MTNTKGYAPVNGLKMYCEVEGDGDPLVFIPSAFGFAGLKSFPALTRSRAVITLDLAAIEAPSSSSWATTISCAWSTP